MEKHPKEAFLYPVKKVPISNFLHNFNIPDTRYTNAIVVETPGKSNIVNFCSSTYGLVPCYDIFPTIECELAKKYKFKPEYSHHLYSKFYVNFIIEGKDIVIGKYIDVVKPVIKIMHSYNSQLKYTLLFGFWRKICSNGAFGFSWEKVLVFKHTENNVPRIIKQSLEEIDKFVDQIDFVQQKYEQLANQEVLDYEYKIKKVLHHSKFPKKKLQDVILRTELESGQFELPITDWLIYNAFNYQLNHANIKMHTEERIKLERKIFNYLFNNN